MSREAEAQTADFPRPLHALSPDGIARKQAIARLTTATLRELTSYYVGAGFDWMLPVLVSKSTDPLWPDPGASIEQRVEAEIYGEKVRTTLSMIVHKMVACSTAYPRLFVLSPNVRIERRERRSTGRHAYEFNQFDFEIRGGTFPQVRDIVEGAVSSLAAALVKERKDELETLETYGRVRGLKTPFDVADRADLVLKHGEAWERGLPAEIKQPVWVRNIPREFYDFEDLASGTWDNYDLFLPEYGEVLSGARREWEYGRLASKMERDGVDKANFSLLLELAKEGRLRPSAGAGIGIERLIGWMSGARHIGEVQPFPRVPGMVYEL